LTTIIVVQNEKTGKVHTWAIRRMLFSSEVYLKRNTMWLISDEKAFGFQPLFLCWVYKVV